MNLQKSIIKGFGMVLAFFLLLSCNPNQQFYTSTPAGSEDPVSQETLGTEEIAPQETPQIEPGVPVQPGNSTKLIQPANLVYLGAFRLPEGSNDSTWEYSGYAMTYYPDGDPDGPDDGFPGSLFALGHDHHQLISEISIPPPVNSPAKNLSELNTAGTLQPFNDITGGEFGYLEIPRTGLEYLPPQGEQPSGKLYFCWGQHMEFEFVPTHGWSEIDLAAPQPAGLWSIGDYPNYITNDYLFEIPEAWAAINTPGLRLATGRFRDGTWSGLGPALLAIGPWLEGNPPPHGTTLNNVTPLLLYGIAESGVPEINSSEEMRMSNFSEPDEWSGGAWLTVEDSSAVIFVGTKATGNSWYGFSNGVVYPISGDPDDEFPDVPPWPHDSRGWWSEDIEAQIIFYNPDEIAAVVGDTMETWDPQPYASLSLDEYLYDPGFDYERQKRYLVGAASFDRENGYLYIMERRADEEKSVVHVFMIET
ncbi:hypothetical protein ACFLY4_07475 [Chloroflexota bacterium]